MYLLLLWPLLLLLPAIMMIRNMKVFNARMKANDAIFKHNINLTINDRSDDAYAKREAAWKIAVDPSYNKMMLSVFDWKFDKMIDVDNRLREINNEQ